MSKSTFIWLPLANRKVAQQQKGFLQCQWRPGLINNKKRRPAAGDKKAAMS